MAIAALCLVEHDSVRFMSRNKKELTKRFPELSTIHHAIKGRSVILDGEIVGLDANDVPSFEKFTKQKEVFCGLLCLRLLDAEWERSEK